MMNTKLKEQAEEIHQKAQHLSIPIHLKMLPEIKNTLALIQDISALLLEITQQGDNDHANH